MTRDTLVIDGTARPEDFVEPEPASDDDVALVHHHDYIRKLKTGTLSCAELLRLEIPDSPELIRAVWLSVGGSILAGRLALRDGTAVNLGGGFTMRCADHGEGF
jgi:acetoin utilization deacetylase AcuC-like enzyme